MKKIIFTAVVLVVGAFSAPTLVQAERYESAFLLNCETTNRADIAVIQIKSTDLEGQAAIELKKRNYETSELLPITWEEWSGPQDKRVKKDVSYSVINLQDIAQDKKDNGGSFSIQLPSLGDHRYRILFFQRVEKTKFRATFEVGDGHYDPSITELVCSGPLLL